jgi:hypothetical protein
MTNELRDVFRIEDPQIDAREIMQRVSENLYAHGLVENIQFPEFDVVPAEFADGARFPAALYYELEQATLAFGQTWVELQPVESRFPLLGRVKQEFHRLVVFYVNRYAERQTVVNGALLRALNQLVMALDASEVEVVALRREVAELHTRLEQGVDGSDTASRGVEGQ